MDGEDDHVHLLVAYPPKTETQGRLRRPRYPSPPSTAGLVAHRVKQAAFLREHGCQILQGYWLSRPLPITEFSQWLAQPLPSWD